MSWRFLLMMCGRSRCLNLNFIFAGNGSVLGLNKYTNILMPERFNKAFQSLFIVPIVPVRYHIKLYKICIPFRFSIESSHFWWGRTHSLIARHGVQFWSTFDFLCISIRSTRFSDCATTGRASREPATISSSTVTY